MVSGVGPGLGGILSQWSNAPAAAGKAASAGSSFGDVFRSAVGGVDQLQNTADQQIANMLSGKGNVDMEQVSVSVEKADIAFQLMMQVRNKVVSAYQDMEKMQF